MIMSNDDLAVDADPERSNIAMKAIRSLQTEMGLGGRPDAAMGTCTDCDNRYRL